MSQRENAGFNAPRFSVKTGDEDEVGPGVASTGCAGKSMLSPL